MSETETNQPTEVTTAPPTQPVSKWAVVGAIVVIAVVIAGVAGLIMMNQSKNNRNLAQARTVADKAIVAIQNRDGAAARAIGTKEFKSMYTDEQLSKQFKAVEVATSQPPKFVRQFTGTDKSRPSVYDIYAYTRLKVPYYVRTTVVKEAGSWKLSNITGNVDQNKLLGQ